MNDNLINFLCGSIAIRVHDSKDMKMFVEWLKKYDIHDILVANREYYDQYFKISFWKDFAKQDLQHKHKWVHPQSLCIYFGWTLERVYWNYDKEQVDLFFADIVEAKDL